MRGKIIAVFSVVVIVVGLLAFALTRATIGDLLANPERAHNEADRAAIAASAQLQLDGLNLQRWLSEQAADPNVLDVFRRETQATKAEAATGQATHLMSLAAAEFKATPPGMIAFVDDGGIALGRDGSSLLRGDDLGKAYPSLLDAIKKGRTASDVWANRARGDLQLTSYAAVRDASGKSLGALIIGTPINDGRLTTVSDSTSGRALVIAVANGDNVDVLAKSNGTRPEILTALTSMKAQVQTAMAAPVPAQLQGSAAGFSTSGLGLRGYGDGKRAAIIALAPVAIGDPNSLLMPVLGSTALGLVLVVFAGILLGSYITRPIVELEEGLLAVINGQADRRFEIEHAEFGGLVFRINTLLNTLMGVPEDDTDEQGRPSRSPNTNELQDAMAVDGNVGGGDTVDRATAAALRDEPADAYYTRLYGEYIAAKKSIGDPTDHITRDAFVSRMQSSEADASSKQGKPVRYKVELRGREVMLIAVPLD